MCLIVLAYKVHPLYPLIVAANRDEFLERPTRGLHVWEDAPHVLAGRDERAGGTWMGLTTTGRFAAVTNYRDLRSTEREGLSRGALVRLALEQDLHGLSTEEYPGLNLFYGPIKALRYHNNVHGADHALEPGIHGLSNHLLNTPWPKVHSAKEAMRNALEKGLELDEALFAMLADGTPARDVELPDTGLSLEWERKLSSIHIEAQGYATRSSTVLLVGVDGRVRMRERSYFPPNEVLVEATVPI